MGRIKRALLGSVSDYMIRHCERAAIAVFHDTVDRPLEK
jgi:nucleotide-binding universal stress UspA family protein